MPEQIELSSGGVEISETGLLAADFEEPAPSLLAGPHVFEGQTLWPLSLGVRHLIIMLSDQGDTRAVEALIVMRVLSSIEADFQAALKDRRDRETAERMAKAAAMRNSTGEARNLFRADVVIWMDKLTPAKLSSALDLREKIYKEANDSELISTSLDGGGPKN